MHKHEKFFRIGPKYLEYLMARKKKVVIPKQYILMAGNDGYPWEAYHLRKGMSNSYMAEARLSLQEHFPNHEVRLYLCQIVPAKPLRAKPYKRIKKLKHVVKTSAEWIKEGYRTAVCNMCGTIGPEVPMNGDGNHILQEAGWHKEGDSGNSGIFATLFPIFAGGQPAFTLRCPSCDEQIANKDTREDWFT